MATVICLREVIDALEMANDEWTQYPDPETGEIIVVGQDGEFLKDDESAGEPDEDRLLPLPSAFDIHEWSIMENFSQEQRSERKREELLDAIHGRGAFRAFKSAIVRLGLEQDWYRFREDALAKIARDWLEENELKYK